MKGVTTMNEYKYQLWHQATILKNRLEGLTFDYDYRAQRKRLERIKTRALLREMRRWAALTGEKW